MNSMFFFQEDILNCSICLSIFQNPKTLPCGHTFCLSPCLEKVITKGNNTCPLCRKDFKLPLSGKLEDLPTNFVAKSLATMCAEQEMIGEDFWVIKLAKQLSILKENEKRYEDSKFLKSNQNIYDSQAKKSSYKVDVSEINKQLSKNVGKKQTDENGNTDISDDTNFFLEVGKTQQNSQDININNPCDKRGGEKNLNQSVVGTDRNHKAKITRISKNSFHTTIAVDDRQSNGRISICQWENMTGVMDSTHIAPLNQTAPILFAQSHKTSGAIFISIGNQFWILSNASHMKLSEAFCFPNQEMSTEVFAVPEGFLIFVRDSFQVYLWTRTAGLKNIISQLPTHLRKNLRNDTSRIIPTNDCSAHVSIFNKRTREVTFYPWVFSPKKRINHFVNSPRKMPQAVPICCYNKDDVCQIFWLGREKGGKVRDWMVAEYTEKWSREEIVAQGTTPLDGDPIVQYWNSLKSEHLKM